MQADKPISMNLPVTSHLDRLADLTAQIADQINTNQKQLQILRGTIIQLSYVNKIADLELNEFLVDSISSLQGKLTLQWDENAVKLAESKKKLMKLYQQHEDIEIFKEQIQEKADDLQHAVGIGM